MNKLEKIARQEQKAREKMAAIQAILKQIDGQRTEQENLQIVQQVRALKLSRDELYAFLGGGTLPPALAGAVTGEAAAPETIHTRRGRQGRDNIETGTPEGEPTTQTEESEGLPHEEE
jgi:type II secretory pathway pseudopilin PulG